MNKHLQHSILARHKLTIRTDISRRKSLLIWAWVLIAMAGLRGFWLIITYSNSIYIDVVTLTLNIVILVALAALAAGCLILRRSLRGRIEHAERVQQVMSQLTKDDCVSADNPELDR